MRPFRIKAYLAQCDGAGGQADEPPFPAVGVLRQGKLLRQGLDHMLDLHRVVLGHELPDQPEEREERVLGQCDQATPAPAAGPGMRGAEDLLRKSNQSHGSCPSSAADWGALAFPFPSVVSNSPS